jgi:hypothetical protein
VAVWWLATVPMPGYKRGMNPSNRRALAILLASGLIPAAGCVRRVVEITSDPAGAVVWMNDREVGVTPCEVEIIHYGEYDLRVIREGWEPVSTGRSANPPVWDLPGPDLIAELLPFEVVSRATWHLELTPEDRDEEAVMDRAIAMRDRLSAQEVASPDPVGDDTPAGLAAEVEEADGSRPDASVLGEPVEGPIGPSSVPGDEPSGSSV